LGVQLISQYNKATLYPAYVLET